MIVTQVGSRVRLSLSNGIPLRALAVFRSFGKLKLGRNTVVVLIFSCFLLDQGLHAEATEISTPAPKPSNDIKSAPAQNSKVTKKRKKKKKKPPPLTLEKRLGPSGSARLGYFSRNKQFSDQTNYLVGALWLSLRPLKIVGGYQTYWEMDIQASDMTRSKLSYGDLREGYVEKSFGPLDLKVGRQIIVWGRADKLNPTDTLSVRDATRLVTDDEDQRLGIGSALAALDLDAFRVISVWQPEWRVPGLLLAPPPAHIAYDETKPAQPMQQYALKIDHSGTGFDFSGSYFNGYDRNPDLNAVSGPSGTTLQFVFQKIQVYGADMAFQLGNYGFRAEASYTDIPKSDSPTLLTRDPFWYGVLGVERELFEDFNLNVQYLYRSIRGWTDPETFPLAQQALEKLLQTASNQRVATQSGASMNASFKAFNEKLLIESVVVYWGGKHDSLWKPKMTYAASDHFKLIIGGEVYNGPDDSFYGRLKPVSTFFAETRYFF